ncbi:hypothetical protein M1523_00085 [Patescibacteria group bacterium]|nr:hypothetical protein [Patescibacteria group bacterium]MCL5091784.1 hypothetical protein [Patescibacteria group bacterium]
MFNWKATIILIGIFLSVSLPADAKLLPRFQAARSSGAGAAVSSGVITSPRLRADHGALIVYFANLQNAASVSYTLMYQSNGVDQGVGGTLDSSAGSSVTRELYFGTCSSGVCRAHSGLANMKLEITIDLTNGHKILRRYRIRV